MSELSNRMKLEEFEKWVSSGKSLRDAAFGLTFEALLLAETSRGRDAAIPILQETARFAILADIAESLGRISNERNL